jgi:hypothetical protein
MFDVRFNRYTGSLSRGASYRIGRQSRQDWVPGQSPGTRKKKIIWL